MLNGWGRGDELRLLPAPDAATVETNRLSFEFGDLTAWYVNGPLGLQQGWTLTKAPGSEGKEPISLVLYQGGNLRARVNDGRDGLNLTDTHGVARLTYGGLLAYDTQGKTLPAWLKVEGEQVRVQVEDQGAVYPITVDPWVQVSKLTTSQGADEDEMGTSVSMNEDGSILVAGAPYHDGEGSDPGKRGSPPRFTLPG
jgi:hypothetical protein